MPPKTATETPLMTQHKNIKAKFPDAILLFRVGDFYETFGADAVITAKVLGITLTKRNNGDKASQELAGFPHHALDIYLHKLVKAGYRVAICDQLEDPKTVKGIVKRGVTEVVTPGLASDDKSLDQSSNNFLCALNERDGSFGIAFIDITTGDFFISEGNEEYVDKLLQSLKPSEILFSKPYSSTFKTKFGSKYFTYSLDEWIFSYDYGLDKLLQQFAVHSLKGFGIESLQQGIIAAGVIIHYLKETEHHQLQQINTIHRMDKDDYLWMDQFTIKNLELFTPHGESSLSLFNTINNTASPMGARLLKKWIIFPLKHKQSIEKRLNGVDFFIQHEQIREEIKNAITQIGDIERFIVKIPLKKINPRELKHIAKALDFIQQIKNGLNKCDNELLQSLGEHLNACSLIAKKIHSTLVEQPPLNSAKGELIQKGIDAELDELKSLRSDAKQHLDILLQQEIAQTGISSLKIHFNNVFGYYLEVSHTHKNKVPSTWIRKQTLVQAERYITPELKIFEEKILHAEDKILAIETVVYQNLLVALQEYIQAIQFNAQCLAQIDCLICFAHNAITYNYCKPVIHEGLNISMTEGRHAVIERNMKNGEHYVPNDIYIDVEDTQIMILTGPNMSGKSAILRQVALSILLTHIGSYVPCKAAHIPLTDKIFTRVGASDNMSAGESTFMVEMNETASILNNISERSLILLDEIGRGTSTYDGISIAWSMVEYLHHHLPFQPKTLFATHYHELNDLEKKLARVKNYHVSYTEVNQKIIFLRKLVLGGIKNSFGIHVAKMAGFPPTIIQRAETILKQLEQSSPAEVTPIQTELFPPLQVNLHDEKAIQLKQFQDYFNAVDVHTITPIEALIKLNELKQLLHSHNEN